MAADYAYAFSRVTISGQCIGGAEEWSTGFQIGSETGAVTEVTPGAAEAVADAWTTFFTASANEFSNSWYTTEVKVALIDTVGHTDQDNIDYYTYSTPVYGNKGGAYFPPQITLAATLTSEYQRGLASKGRMYLPGLNSALDQTTGKLGSTFTNTLNTNFKAFLDAVNDNEAAGAYIIIASKGHKTTALDTNGQPVYENGRNARVTGCRIGNVYDTQRRRRDGLTETYNTKVLA